MDKNMESSHLIELTADIASAFVSKNTVALSELPRLIAETHRALEALTQPAEPAEAAPQPAVSIRRSIRPDFLISLEDGQQYRTLKRHLSRLGMSPEQYREKWGLPKDYPMVAAAYSARRSELARSFGLGRKRQPEAAPPPKAKAAAVTRAPRKRKTAAAANSA